MDNETQLDDNVLDEANALVPPLTVETLLRLSGLINMAQLARRAGVPEQRLYGRLYRASARVTRGLAPNPIPERLGRRLHEALLREGVCIIQ